MRWTTLIAFIAVLIGAGFLFRDGYERRKPHWTGASWRRFGIGLALIATMLGLPLLMGIAVDNDLYAEIGASVTFRKFWVAMNVVLVIGGTTAAVLTLHWFAKGEPTKPCPSLVRPSTWFRT